MAVPPPGIRTVPREQPAAEVATPEGGPFGVATDPEAERQTLAAIETAKLAWREAFRRGDTAALAALYAPDANLVPSDDGVEGRDRIVEYLTRSRSAGVRDARMETLRIVRVDDVAYEVGSYELEFSEPGTEVHAGLNSNIASPAPGTEAGRYYAIWKAQKDGTWRYQVAIWSGHADFPLIR